MKQSTLLDNKTVSSFPVGIGTGLALESMFDGPLPAHDTDRQIPTRVIHEEYPKHYWNVCTLLRNLLGSFEVPAKDLITTDPKLILELLEDEVNVLTDIYDSSSVELVVYFSDPSVAGMGRYKHLAVPRSYTGLTKWLMTLVVQLEKIFKDTTPFSEVREPVGNTLVSTHVVADLLHYRKFSRLSLLESHTGVLKERHHWNSKYYPIPGQTMDRLPFLDILLYILGDKVSFKPWKIKARRELFELAKKHKWTPNTRSTHVYKQIHKLL